ncbi:MAG: dTMP kinase [Sulfolobales archaeon]
MSRLIVIEGIDGSGKTTLARNLVRRLMERGFKSYYTYEPYESPFSEVFRKIKTLIKTDPTIDALAMTLDRAYHVKMVIEPLLEEGYIVVSDRYYYSTIAYQGAMGADITWIKNMNKVFRKPDLGIYIDVSVDTALERIKMKESRWPEYEVRELLEKVRKIYLEMVREGELEIVCGEKKAEEVIEEAWRIITGKIDLENK